MTPLQDAFLHQARSCAALDSPFMARLLTTLAEIWPQDTALARTCDAWTGDIGPNGASLPLRIASGLHALVLGGDDEPLARAYPPGEAGDLAAALGAALSRHDAYLADWVLRPPQTNEVRRSVALIPAAHTVAARFPGLPFVTSELGASAGLNLMWDRYALETATGRLGPEDAALSLAPAWTGPLPPAAAVQVAARAGVDLSPLDPRDPQDRLRLLSYLWPDQPQRAALTRAALATLDTAVDRGDAVDWIAHRLPRQPEGHIHLVYHTIAWQYLPPDRQAHGRALIEAAGMRATARRPLAWLGLEHDGDAANARGAALRLRLWPGDGDRDGDALLARVDFHGRWVDWLAG